MRLVLLATVLLTVTSCAEKTEVGVSRTMPVDGSDRSWELCGQANFIKIDMIERDDDGGEEIWLLVKGRLPLGTIKLSAVSIEGEYRKSAFIYPDEFENTDPDANRRWRPIGALRGGDYSLGDYVPFTSGHFVIYATANGEVLASTELVLD